MDVINRYIKRVTIKNFLTYKDQDVADIDSKINLVFGVNGSGKTSFFKCIEFALTKNIKYSNQLFTSLSNDQNVKELSVSVQFSNEYIFVRKLFPQNENYLINNKPVNQANYHHLLKYYFMDNNILIPQGQINQLVATTDKLRNELIKFTISMNNIDELKEMIDQIMDRFEVINELRSSLFNDLEARQEDKRITEKVSQIKDEIRLIQSVIQSRKIDSLRQRIKSKKVRYDQVKNELNELIQEQVTKTTELNELKQAVEDEDVLNGLFSEESFKELTTKKVQLDLENEDYCRQFDEKEQEQAKLREQIGLLREQIESKQLTLEQLKPRLEESKEREKSMHREIQLMKLEIDQLFLHDDRQKDVQKAELESLIEVLQAELSMLENNIDELTSKRDEFDKLVKKYGIDQIEINGTIERESQTMNKLRNENLNWETIRRKLCAEMDKHKESLNKYLDRKRNFYSLIGRAVLKGRQNLDKVIEIFKNGTDEEKKLVDNYYGWFIDNISFDKTFALPIERTGFHYLHKHIVQDLNTANRLLKKFNEMQFDGTLEFVVLDLLKIKNDPTDSESPVYQPLIKYIGHEKKVERAVKNCFQRVYLCRSIGDVIQLKKDFTFVTLDGDLLLRKRSLNGGYIDKNRLWIENYSKYQICERFLVETTEKLNGLKQSLLEYENKLQQNSDKIDQCEQLKSRKHLEKHDLRLNLTKTQIELEECTQLIKNYRKMYKRKSSELEDLKSRLELVKNRPELSESERLKKISSLQTEQERLNVEYGQMIENCNQVKLEFKSLKVDLKENLLKQQVDLRNKLKQCELENTALKAKSSNCQSTIKILEDSINQMLKRKNGSQGSSQASNASQKLEQQLELVEKRKQICQLQHSIEQITFKEIELKFNLKKNLQMQRTYEDEITLYQSQMDQVAKKANQYIELDSKTLVSKLTEFQDDLVEIGSQHTPVISEDLYEQRYLEINNILIAHRDLMGFAIELFKKEITVERSLQTLSLFFSRFQQILTLFKPDGKIQVQIRVPHESFIDNSISEKFSLHDLWSTVYVSFAGELPRRIDCCSGGQKTTLSLCYLLSILTLKPQPFMLIDETDQNLDEETCLKLGSIIKENFADRIQFLFSSNRKYFAAFADKIFKVSMERNQSHLSQVEFNNLTSPEHSQSNQSFLIPESTSQEDNEDAQRTPKRHKTKH